MPRPDPRRPREGQLGLFEKQAVKEPDMVLRGRHSEAMDRAIIAAQDQDGLAAMDEGLETVLRAGAWALDSFESQNKPYGPTKIIDQMVAALREARMTPDSRDVATDDEIKDLLHGLGPSTPSDSTPSHAQG
ncbi:hypothetical protein ACUY2G_04930 [Corynebacterium guaraldiae]